MTLLELPGPARLAFGPVSVTRAIDFMPGTERSQLSVRDCVGVVARNTTMTVKLWLEDGRKRFARQVYCSVGPSLFVSPTASLAVLLDRGDASTIEADVSEVDGMRFWRYVSLTGSASLLQPTGSTDERREWLEGVEQLKRIVTLPPIPELQFANFGLLRIDNLTLTGSAVRLDVDDVVLPESPAFRRADM